MKRQPASIISYRLRSVRRARDLVTPLLRYILALITATLLASLGSAFAAGSVSAATLPRFAPGRILVAPQPGTLAADFQQALVAQGGRSLGPLRGLDVHVVEVPIGGEPDAVTRLAGSQYVLFAEFDGLTAPALNVNDPKLSKEWHLAKISAPTAWDTSTGSGITIAILDTGVDGNHPDLAAQMVPGWNLFDDNDNTSDVLGHGTAVAGVAAAASNNGVGIAGVAGGARIMPLRITDAAGNAYWSTTAQALTWAADHGADVANISFDGMAASSTMQAAASHFRSNGGTVIVAAGNTGAVDNTARTDTMVVVSATDSRDRIASWSTRGSFVDISAPGQSIYSTAKGGGYGTWSGTSMAAPMVAGTAALVFALRPDLTPAQVDSTLLASAKDLGAIGPDIYFGFGRLNAAAAVKAAAAVAICTRANPTLAITPSQTAGVPAGTMVPLNVTVANNDTTACAASTFDLTRSIPAGWTATLLSSAISLSPGTSDSTTLQVTSPTGTPDGPNPVSATVTNRSVNTALRSASATYVVANAVQPVCTRANPTLTITPSQSAGVQAGTMVPFNVTVTNNDTTACAASSFDLTRSIPASWMAIFLSAALSLSPGTSGSTTLQVTSLAGTTNSSNSISATAMNRNATTFLRAASATYVVANAVPGAPTIGTAAAGNAQASVSFTAPASNGGSVITAYTVTSSPGGFSASGAASPLTVPGLANGTAYTFTVKATNAVGTGAASGASNSVTPAAPIAVAPSFFGDWESGTVIGSGNKNWKEIEIVAPDRFTVQSDGGARQGSRYARVEVRFGDNPLKSGGQDTGRAEVSYMQHADNSYLNENLNSGTQQYAFSVKLDSTWRIISGNFAKGIFIQLHGPNVLNTNPAWAMDALDTIRFNLRTGDIASSVLQVHQLSNGSLNIGKWIDFILTIKYAKDNTGFVTILRRDEGHTTFAEVLHLTNTPTLQFSSAVNGGAVGDHYIKHGLYRIDQPFTSILYLDNFTRTAVSTGL